LAKAGVTRATADPPGGEILKDAAGNPTGLLNESAQSLANDAMARDRAKRTSAEKEAEAQRAIDLAAAESLSKGITSFEDAGSTPDVVARLKARAEQGTLPLRIWVMLRISNT